MPSAKFSHCRRAGIVVATTALGFALASSPAAMAQTTTFHDRAGRVTGKARTDATGTTTYYDAAGRVTGKASTPRR